MAFNIFGSKDAEQLKKVKQDIIDLKESIKEKDIEISNLRRENIMLHITKIDNEEVEEYKRKIRKHEDSYNELLKKYNELLKEYNTIKNSAQMHVVRPSRKTDKNMKLIKEFKQKNLSYSQIAKAMEKETGEKWAKSTIYMFLNG